MPGDAELRMDRATSADLGVPGRPSFPGEASNASRPGVCESQGTIHLVQILLLDTLDPPESQVKPGSFHGRTPRTVYRN